MAATAQEANLKTITNDLNVLATPKTEQVTSGKDTSTSKTATASTASAPPPPIYLREWIVDPSPSEADSNELHKQRTACGWHSERVPVWAEEIQKGFRRIWFIHLETETGLSGPVGMISLNLLDAADESMANLLAPPTHVASRGRDRVEIGSLFIYPAYRRLGIGEAAIRILEGKAKEVGARVITLNTTALGENVSRYERMGYKQWKVEKKYKLEDVLGLGLTEEYCYAAFLEKDVV